MASRFDDDDEVMKFEVTEEDLAEEAGGFMGAGRGRGRQSKEQALYGVWAESSDKDERPTMGGGSKGKKEVSQLPSILSVVVLLTRRKKVAKRNMRGMNGSEREATRMTGISTLQDVTLRHEGCKGPLVWSKWKANLLDSVATATEHLKALAKDSENGKNTQKVLVPACYSRWATSLARALARTRREGLKLWRHILGRKEQV